MKQKLVRDCLLIVSFVIAISSCGQQQKTEEATATSDSAATQPAAATEAPIPDAVTAAPNVYKVLKDTLGVRVLDISVNAGDTVAMHSHPDGVLYVVEGGKAEFTGKDGSKTTNELKSGTILVQPAHTHIVKNVGTAPVKAVMFEVSRPNNPGAAQNAALDPAKVSSALYKVEKDTMNLRVLTATYKPGATSKSHAHPDHLGYVIEGGTIEMTGKDGTKMSGTFPAGAVLATPAGEHIIKNTGKTNLKVLLVELNRAAQ